MAEYQRIYGFNIYNQQPEDRFEYASTCGIRHVEINLSHNNLSLEKFTKNRITKLSGLAQSHQINLSLHIPYFINISDVLIHLRRNSRSYLQSCITLASELNVRHVTMHLGSFYWFPVEQWERKKGLERFTKSLLDMISLCEDKAVTIALENVVPIPRGSEYYLLGDSIEDFEYIFSNLDSDCIKFCLDTGHANLAEGVLPYVDRFHDKLCCIHYHDNNGSNDEHLPVGQGTIPWQAFASKLKDIQYKGPLISECRKIEAHQSAALFEKYFNSPAAGT